MKISHGLRYYSGIDKISCFIRVQGITFCNSTSIYQQVLSPLNSIFMWKFHRRKVRYVK